MKVWTIVKQLLLDDSFMSKYTREASRFLPLHLAFLFSGDKLVSVASNVCAFGHAERNCVKNARNSLTKPHRPQKLVVVRIGKYGTHAMSRPCHDCCIMLRHALPRARVFYTGEDGCLCEECSLDNSHLSLSRRNRMYADKKINAHGNTKCAECATLPALCRVT